MKEQLPKATHDGKINVSDFDIDCYNLDNGERVLSRVGFLRAMGRTGKAKGGRKYDNEFRTPVFLSAINIKPLVTEDLLENSKPILFTDLNGNQSIGYKAELLPEVSYLYAEALDKGLLKTNQVHIGEQAKRMVRAFLKVSIIALVDEATGYQNDIDRAKDELQQLLAKFLLKEKAAAWIKTFPDEFFEMIFKMKGWTWISISKSKRPQVMGHYINDLIYARLAPHILEELRAKNLILETGKRGKKHFQWLTPDFGHPKLKEHIAGVLAIGRASGYNWASFIRLMNRSYPRYDKTLEILFPLEDVSSLDAPQKNSSVNSFDTQLKGLLAVPPMDKKKKKE